MISSYKGLSINTTKLTHERIYDLIKQNHESVIVDIPSGSGTFVQRLKDGGFKNVKAVDIENILEIDHEDFCEGDMTKELPFDSDSCDVVVCNIYTLCLCFYFSGLPKRWQERRQCRD